MTANDRRSALRRAVEIFITPDDQSVLTLAELFTDKATVWSPNILAEGLEDRATVLGYREGAFSDVGIEFNTLDVFGNKGLAEICVVGKFSGPFLVDDEVVIEPNGEQIVLGAAVVADFDGDKISALRGYFDDSTLLEQMLPA